MSEIPEELRERAKETRDKLCLDCTCTFDAGCGCLDAIAAALLAERSSAIQGERARCVAVARTRFDLRDDARSRMCGATIADAIIGRQPHAS